MFVQPISTDTNKGSKTHGGDDAGDTNLPTDDAEPLAAAAAAALQRAVDAFLGVSLVNLSADELVAALDVVETQSRRLPAVRDALVAEAKFRGVAEARGFRSTSTWLRERFVITKGEAWTWLQGADRLAVRRTLTGEPLEPALPATAAARAAGALSAAQVKVIDDLDDELPRRLPIEARREIEAAMVAHAVQYDATKLTRLGQRLLDAVDPDGTEPSTEEAHRRRGITIGPLRRGLARISGHVDAWTREAILAVLASLSDPDPSRPQSETREASGAAPCEADRSGTPRDGDTAEPTSPDADATTGTSDEEGENESIPADWWPQDDWSPPPECGDQADSAQWWLHDDWAPPRGSDDRADPAEWWPQDDWSPPPECDDRAGSAEWWPQDNCNPPDGRDVDGGCAAADQASRTAARGSGGGPPDAPVQQEPDDQLVDLPMDPDRRLHPQRLHDALRDGCERLLASSSLPRRGGTPATILLTVPLDTLERRTGLISTAHGGDIPVREVIRRAGDATIIPIVIDREGNPLFLGREKRLATPAQRHALHVRDGGCVIPGCMTPSQSCQTHHLVDWALGGPTDLTNLALLCSYHHHRIADWTLYLKHGRIWCVPPSWVNRDQTPRVNTYFREPKPWQLDLSELASLTGAT